jgi:DNA polymerase-3 subunit alpha/error-prone DNA polymerase
MWGTASVRALCVRAKALGYTRLALTDTDNLYGLWPFLFACRDLDLRPIVGAELTDPLTPHRAVCLVKDITGYQNLCRLITARHRDPLFSLETAIPDLGQGLVVLTRSPGLLTAWTGRNKAPLDLAAALPRHALPARHPLCRTATALGLPLVATPGAFFLLPGAHRIHTLTRAIANNTCISRLSPGELAPKNAFLASPDVYARRFAVLPQALDNTRIIAEKLEFTGPCFGIVMPPYDRPRGTFAPELLRQKAYEGAIRRYGAPLPGPVVRRLDHELSIIRKMNFSTYFLVVHDIVSQASRTCGRGSGAASIVAYALNITNVCPIKHGLYFERFLNPGRTDPPDLDIDFAWDERDAILKGVLSRFQGRSAMVASHILFQPRMAVRETAKVFGLPEKEIKKVTARLPGVWRQDAASPGDLLAEIKKRPAFRHMDFSDPWPKILALARALTGTPRHLSVHPGGIVITPEPIDTYVPVETAPKGIPLIQWEKDSTEAAGLVKIDLLGNRSLGVIRDCIHTIDTHNPRPFSDFQHQDPEDDLATQKMVAQGLTMGCFYIESPAMRLLLKKARVGDFQHLVIHASIIRPAANTYIQAYLQRLHTGNWEPLHPLLEEVLEETFGIMVFQEDVSRVAVRLAGFSHAYADGLRKIMSKKDKTRALQDYYRAFQAGAGARGVSREKINRIWEMILSFSGYSFCKPHSASYARVSFQAAYLKTHYPAEFMAAVISNQGGFYATFAYVSEARRLGVHILPPDVSQSLIRWQGKKHRIRVGLMAIKGLGMATMAQIIEQREQKAFSGIRDFLSRIRPRKDAFTLLCDSGSLDTLNSKKSRAALTWAFWAWKKNSRQKPTDRGCRSPELFDATQQQAPVPDLPPDPPGARLRQEFRALGFLCTCHPMILFARQVQALKGVKAADIHRHLGKNIRFAGWLITGKTVKTKQGDPMTFLTFEDETGTVETVFFPRPYARFCHSLDYGCPYILFGKVNSEWNALTLIVETAQKLAPESTNGNTSLT